MFRREDTHLKTENYLGLSSIIILLLILMFFIINLALFMRKASEALHDQQYTHLERNNHPGKDIIERESAQDYFFTLVTKTGSIVEDSLKKAKIPYFLTASLKDIKVPQGHIILEGKMLKDPSDLTLLKGFIEDKQTILLLNMPELEYIKNNGLEEVLGIATIGPDKIEKELNLVPGFMLGGFHEFQDMAYNSSRIELLSTTKVYGFAENNAPIIWRNTYKGSEIYVVNGPFMETNAAYGILSALMGEIYETYIYPVINTRFMTYDGFPYLSHENTVKLETIYNRDAMKLQNDILLPDVLTINKRRDFVPNGYLTIGFKEMYANEIDTYNIKQINSCQTQIYKEGGEVGMRYSGNLGYDKKMYQTIFPGTSITSILLGEPTENMDGLLGVSDTLESIVGPWIGTNAFEYLNDKTVYIPYTLNGIHNSGSEELDFISGITAFGAVVQNLDLEDVVMVKGDQDVWKTISRDYIKFIDNYRQRFDFLENRDATQTAHATQVFRNNTPKIKISTDKIQIRFEHWYGKSYYILRTNKEISNIKNGKIKQIEEGIYLVTATDKEVDIHIKGYEIDKGR